MRFALIPARSGSKRIVGKNIKSFSGKPLIAYSIDAALRSGLFDDVIVSTDCEHIAKLSRDYGASTPFMRPKKLSDDFTGTRDVISHAITTLQEQGRFYDYCCCIYATAPFVQTEYLKLGLQKLLGDTSKSFAFSICTFDFPVQRAIKFDDGDMAAMFPEHVQTRSQDLEEAYHDAGQFYWGSSESFLSDKALFSEHAIGINIPRHLVQDIDTIEDWQRAELMFKAYVSQKL